MGEEHGKFERCVKKVKKNLKEGAAIAICTKTVLWKRGLTLKTYTKGRVVTKKRKLKQ
jgi:hypothetical protein